MNSQGRPVLSKYQPINNDDEEEEVWEVNTNYVRSITPEGNTKVANNLHWANKNYSKNKRKIAKTSRKRKTRRRRT